MLNISQTLAVTRVALESALSGHDPHKRRSQVLRDQPDHLVQHQYPGFHQHGPDEEDGKNKHVNL